MSKKRNGRARDFSMKSTNVLTSSARSRDSVFQEDPNRHHTQRSTRRQVTWIDRHAVLVSFLLIGLLAWFVILIVASMVSIGLAPALSKMSIQNGWHFGTHWFASIRNHGSIFTGSMFFFIGQVWPVIGAMIVGALFSVGIGKRARVRIAKIDDSAMETDVNDSWIWSVPEMVEHYAVIADLGAHSRSVPVSSIVGHIYLKNNGIRPIMMAQHDDTGAILRDEDGEVIRKKMPLFNHSEIRKILDIQGLRELDVKEMLLDPTKLDYDEKDGKVRTLADMINEDWYMPDYEILRPMGAYFVETNSVHTLVLSMTRGNKTQLVTHPTIDAWRRDSTFWNLLVNDPKGEMMMASYQLLQKAGYDVVPFLLTHPDVSVRYNPLQMIIENARRGRMPEASTELSNLSSTFFPSTGGDDFWIQTARAVFQMMTWQLLNYMIDEERRAIRLYQSTKSNRPLTDQSESLGNKVRPVIRTQTALDRYIDDLWGKVSMNSMYQMIARLDKLQMPDSMAAAADTKYSWDPSNADYEQPEQVSGLDILANAITELPENAIRRNFKGPQTMMSKAGGSDATVGSIYATALNNMAFFVQETIKKLTTVSPRNGLNILDFPFPRRFSVRLSSSVMERLNLKRKRFRATLYKDPFFKQPYGDKTHETIDEGAVESSGWIDFWFQKIPKPKTKQFYIQIEILDGAQQNVTVRLRFAIDKGYLTNENGTQIIKDPVTGRPIVKDGTAFEVKPMTLQRAQALQKAGKPIKMSQRHDTYVLVQNVRDRDGQRKQEPVVAQTMFNYTERPKAIFLSVPPQVEEQSKLALVLIDSIFNTSMGKGYEVRGDTQKPDYGTRYMLEELGNLKADNVGIASLDTKLSIGLSALQQMTMVFQSTEQVSSIYGKEMVDTLKANVGTIHYTMSRSDETVSYISELTGKTHRIDISSQGTSEIIGSLDGNDNTISTNKSKTEVAVIPKEVVANLTDGETIVVTPTRRRDNMQRVTRVNPVLNTKEQLMPFAYALLQEQTKATIRGGYGTAETASTVYSTVDSQPDQMVPDFMHVLRITVRQAMYYKRHEQALQDKFISKTTPFGSESLSEAIMDYMNYEIDVNRELIKDGLAPYMMLTKTEILTAYGDKGDYALDRGLAAELLSKLGFDPNEELALPVIEDDDPSILEALSGSLHVTTYMDSALNNLTADDFDETMSAIASEANKGGDSERQFLSMLVQRQNWRLPDGVLGFKTLTSGTKVMFDSKKQAVLKVDQSAEHFRFAPSDDFRTIFEGDRGNSGDIFEDNEIYEVMSNMFSEYND